jgi:hypothetical protein
VPALEKDEVRFEITLIPGEPAMLLDTKGDPLEPTK